MANRISAELISQGVRANGKKGKVQLRATVVILLRNIDKLFCLAPKQKPKIRWNLSKPQTFFSESLVNLEM